MGRPAARMRWAGTGRPAAGGKGKEGMQGSGEKGMVALSFLDFYFICIYIYIYKFLYISLINPLGQMGPGPRPLAKYVWASCGPGLDLAKPC